MATLAEQLEQIDAAIAKALEAQSIGSEGRTLTRASLATLYAQRDKIEARLARQNSRGRGGLIGQRRER